MTRTNANSMPKIWQARPSGFWPCFLRGLSSLTRIPTSPFRVATLQSCNLWKFSRAPAFLASQYWNFQCQLSRETL